MSENDERAQRLEHHRGALESRGRMHGRAMGRLISGGGSSGSEFIDHLALMSQLLPGDKIQNEIIRESVDVAAAQWAARHDIGRRIQQVDREFQHRGWPPLSEDERQLLGNAIDEHFRKGMRQILDPSSLEELEIDGVTIEAPEEAIEME